MNYKFCPYCGQATLNKDSETKISCSNCGNILWNNPKACVSVIFVKENLVLFSKRDEKPNKGKYDFPGGFLEYNEDPYQACIREIQEETTMIIQQRDLKLMDVHTIEHLPSVSVTDLVFVITNWQGEPHANDDSAALEWKTIDFIEDPQFVPHYKKMADQLINTVRSI